MANVQTPPERSSKSPASRFAGVAILLVVLAGALWARFHFTANAASFSRYMQGVQLMQSGHTQDAVTLWEDLVVKDPEFPDTYVALATYYTNQGDPQHSLNLIEQAQAQHVDNPDLELALAEAYVRLGDKRALAAAKEAVKLEPDNYRSHLALSTAYAQAYDEAHTIPELMSAEQLAPKNVTLYLLAMEYLATANNYDKVEDQARKCLAIDASNGEALYYLGWSLVSKPTPERLAEAENALKQAVAVTPDSFRSWLELGNVEMKRNEMANARTSLEKARALGSKPSPEGSTEPHLRDQIRNASLLAAVYRALGQSTQADKMEAEADNLSARVANLPKAGSPPPPSGNH